MDPITISLASGLVLLSWAVTIGGSYAVINWRTGHLEKENERLGNDLDRLRGDLHSYQLDAAQRFVTDDMLTKVETKVLAAIDRLADRLDKIIDAQVRA